MLSETLRDTLPIPCKNVTNGCEVVLFKEDLEEHEKGCILRNIYCADYLCHEKPVFKDFIDHYTANHCFLDAFEKDGLNKDCDVFRADFNMEDSHCGLSLPFHKFHNVFFEVGCIENGIMKRWVRFYGSPSDAKYLEYESHLTSPDGCKIITVDQVVSLDEPPPESPKFMILMNVAESYQRENGFSDYEIKIRNLKEEAKDDDEESGVSDVGDSDN